MNREAQLGTQVGTREPQTHRSKRCPGREEISLGKNNESFEFILGRAHRKDCSSIASGGKCRDLKARLRQLGCQVDSGEG